MCSATLGRACVNALEENVTDTMGDTDTANEVHVVNDLRCRKEELEENRSKGGNCACLLPIVYT